MNSVDLYARVRRACHVDGMSQREAARVFGIDPKTVAKMLRFSVPPGASAGERASRLREGHPKRGNGHKLSGAPQAARRVRERAERPRERPMDLDMRLQRAFDRVELVSGSIGNPGEGRMCLMSLVAFLAGEAHSDSHAPRCASPLIQTFAVLVNDHMPREARQRLKPFAPRIIGTNDGFDQVRTEILRHAFAEGILAKALGQCVTGPAPTLGRLSRLRRLLRWLRKEERGHLLALSRDGVNLAREAARLIARSARRAPCAREQERHWDVAIGLLDMLCDVGAPTRCGPGIRAERLAQLEGTPRPRQERPGARSPPFTYSCEAYR